jgi:cell division protein ZapA
VAQVSVLINGYSYHLTAMAAQVERRIDNIKALGNQSGEARVLVLAALLMADELHDLQIELSKTKRGPAPRTDSTLAKTLGKLADRAEEIAGTLERP